MAQLKFNLKLFLLHSLPLLTSVEVLNFSFHLHKNKSALKLDSTLNSLK